MGKRNDQRSNVKNPNNPAYKHDRDNRSNQKNPNNKAYPSKRGKYPPHFFTRGNENGRKEETT